MMRRRQPARASGIWRIGARAFALPLVVMLTLVVVVLIAAMLGRQSTQSVTVARQAEGVRDWHFSRGVREIIDQWIKNKAAGSIRDTLAVDGRAFDLVFEDDTRISLYLVDAQGTLPTSLTGFSADDTLEIVGALDQLRQSVSPFEYARMTRTAGPAGISIWTAAPEVLGAVCRQIAGPGSGDELARSLIELRQGKEKLTPGDLADLATKASLSDGRRRAFSRLIATEPSLFRFVLEVRPPTGSTPAGRFTGVLMARSVQQQAGATAKPGAQSVRSAFLSWEKVSPR